ncbi:MAG: hypothetical protein WAT19_09775 [Ferruginibacter sp.]
MRNKTRIYSWLSALLVVFSLGFFSACNNNAEKKEPEVKPETTTKEATPAPETPQAKPDSIDTTGIIKPVIPPN